MRNRSTGTLVLIGISCFAQEVMAQCPGIKPEFAWHSDGSTILFQDLTNYLGYTPTSRSWSFGDGYFGMGTDTVHTYDTTGVALAEFQVFIGACEYHATALVAHGGASDNCGVPLFADFASTPTGNNNEMSFTDQSFSSGQGFADLWEFGDGALDLSLSPG